MKWIQDEIDDRLFWILSGIMLVIGFFLRFYNLYSDSLWLDEIITLNVSQESLDSIFEFRKRDYNPPLYDILQKLTLSVFPVHDEFSVRFLSAAIGIAGLLAILYCCKKLFGLPAATLTLALASASLTNVFYAREARPYSLMFLAAVLSIFYAFEILDINRPSYKKTFLYVISLLLLSYSHYGGLILAFWIAIGVQCYSLFYRRNVKLTFISHLVVFFGYLPWLTTTLHHAADIPGWMGNQCGSFLVELQRHIQFTFGYGSNTVPAYFTVTIAFLVYCYYKKDFTSLKNFFFLSYVFLVPFSFLIIWLTWISPRAILSRHLIGLTAPLFVAAGFMLTKIIRKKNLVFVLSLSVFIFLLWHLVIVRQYFNFPHKNQLREASEWFSQQKEIKSITILAYGARAEASDFYLQKYNLKSYHLTGQPKTAEIAWDNVKNENKLYLIETPPDDPAEFFRKIQVSHELHQVAAFFQVNIYELDKKTE